MVRDSQNPMIHMNVECKKYPLTFFLLFMRVFVECPFDGAIVFVERQPLATAEHLLHTCRGAVDHHLVEEPAGSGARVVVPDVDGVAVTTILKSTWTKESQLL